MSNRYKGAVISATPPTTTGGESGTASGAWTLEQQMQLQAAGLWPAQPLPPNIEDVFSTFLYTGTDTAQTLTNSIDVSGKGGLVWIKARGNGNRSHTLFDSATYTTGQYYLATNITNGLLDTGTPGMFGLTNSGFSVQSASAQWNALAQLFTSWTFRKQAKFFDVVTYTGNGAATRDVAHSLNSKPGFVVIKRLDAPSDWGIWHRGDGTTAFTSGALQTVDAIPSNAAFTALTSSTTFRVGTGGTVISGPTDFFNTNGATYVAYLWAHDAGGFGSTGTENVISCGTFLCDTFGGTASLPFPEAQWALVRCATGSGQWFLVDNMRGLYTNATDANALLTNTAAPEATRNIDYGTGSSNGQLRIFGGDDSPGNTYIYMAIRRGPMKAPTVATNVFKPIAYSGTGTTTINTLSTTFPVDLYLFRSRSSESQPRIGTRLTGNPPYLLTALTNAESNLGGGNGVNNDIGFASNIGLGVTGDWNNPSSPDYSPYIMECFRRAPSFMDVVCYTGTGVARTVAHNLGVAPEMLIVKYRSTSGPWYVYVPSLGNTYLSLNTTNAIASAPSSLWNSTAPTSSVFSLGTLSTVNEDTGTYVAYLFGSCAGVSKVGSYTGTGAAQTINCGFAAGSRFVMIKRTDSTGDWYFWDSARGIIPSNDPYLLINSAVAEVTGTDYVDTTAVGFDVTSTAPAAINANGGTYIFLAIA